jgi:alpha-L-rhamnosidase
VKFLALALAALSLAVPGFGAVRPIHLRCEYLTDPLGIDARAPLLTWQLDSDRRGEMESAYEVRVAADAHSLERTAGLLWDSGKAASDGNGQAIYRGEALRSGMRCFWKVRVWDGDGKSSGWSAPASWEMGLLDKADWTGHWIGATTDTEYRPAPYLRRSFALSKPIESARLTISGLGYYELHCNGKRVGDHVLDPGYTRYDRRALYVTYDLTPYLRRGENAIGAILGTGWQNVHTRAVWYFDRAPWRAAPRLLANLRVRYRDGTSETIATDHQWRVATGPIVFDSIYGGESYDARLEMPGWDTAGFRDDGWRRASEVEAPGGLLTAQAMPPIRATQMITPVEVTESKPGVFVFDLGQGLSGHARLTVSAPAGTRITMRYGERLHPDGTLDATHLAQHQIKTDPPQQFQTDIYICKGGGVETWEARFVYHGFQYVEVTGLPGKPSQESLKAVFTHTDVPSVGEFSCSNALLNRIWRNTRWSYLSNLASIPTDCPHREKNGWTGDAHLAAEAGLLNFDGITLYRKWVDDIADEQRPSGELPGIVPSSGWGYEWGNGPAWDSAYLLVPMYLYLYYGDARILTSHYEGMRRYVDYLTTRAMDGIVSIGLGDWVPWKTETPVEVTSTAYYYRDALIVAKTAELLGRRDEAAHYAALADSIRRAFLARFYDRATHSVANGGQTALSCALYQELVPTEDRPAVLASLVAAVEKCDNHIDTGILGAKYLLNTLTDCGRTDVAYQIAAQKTEPGWGWWVEQGATTLWESWGGTDSRNHIMFGDISAWFVKALAGINPDPSGPGFRHILIQPHVVGDLTSATAHYDSVRGRIESGWRLEGDRLTLRVRIPANATAIVRVPTTDPKSVTEAADAGGALTAAGIVRHAAEPGFVAVEVGSGEYVFRSRWKAVDNGPKK